MKNQFKKVVLVSAIEVIIANIALTVATFLPGMVMGFEEETSIIVCGILVLIVSRILENVLLKSSIINTIIVTVFNFVINIILIIIFGMGNPFLSGIIAIGAAAVYFFNMIIGLIQNIVADIVNSTKDMLKKKNKK